MAVYRQIHISFWQDTFVLDLTPEEKFFYIYLMTNSKTSQCGIYELPKKIMETETGYNRETIDKLLKRFVEYGKIQYCEETKEIIVLNWMKYNAINSVKVKACITKELQQIKYKGFVKLFLQLCIQYRYPIDTVCIDLGEEKEEEEEEEIEKEREEKKDILSLDIEALELCKYYETLKPGQSITHDLSSLKIFITDYKFEWCKEALQKTVLSTGRFVPNYMLKILKDWATNGKEPNKGGNNRDAPRGNSEANTSKHKIKVNRDMPDLGQLNKSEFGEL